MRADVVVPDPSAIPAASPTGTAAADPNTFRPTEGGNEIQSGERLMVEAYAAIWIILFVFLLFSWRRQKALDARVAALEGAIAAARSSASGRHAGARQRGGGED